MKKIFVMFALMTGAVSAFAQNAADSISAETGRVTMTRELHKRYRWVVRWREARLQCLYPKRQINTYYSYYDRRTGLRTNFNSSLSRLSAAKAQISIAERKEREYIQYQRTNNLFFDENTDEQLVGFREKLRMKKEKYTALEHEIRSEMESMQKLNRI